MIENSKGDYIHVLGDDDLLAPNFYATLLPFLRQKRYGMICTGVMCSRDIDCREIVIKDSAFIRMLDEEPPSEFIKTDYVDRRIDFFSHYITSRMEFR